MEEIMDALSLVAQAAVGGTLVQYVIIAVIVCGVIGIGMIALRQSGIAIPPFVISIAWIVLVVVVAILAIKFIASLL
jgi:hypothetical protein